MKLISLNLPSPPANVKVLGTAGDSNWFPGTYSDWTQFLPNTSFNYAASVGDGLGSSVLMSPIKWVQRTFPEAPLVLIDENDESGDPIFEHPMLKLIEKPNEFYCYPDLMGGTIYSYIVDGNAYWEKIRSGSRGVMELWYRPHWMVEPKWVGNEFISFYEYNPGGTMQKRNILPEDIVHFRNGINPRNTRKGMSMIYSELREIFGDDEAANFVATMMKNMGVPGIVWSPEGDGVVDNPEVLKEYLKQQFRRDKRGDPLVASIATKIQQFGFDPKQMDVSVLRDISEERICAAIGVRASVIGYGAGLQTTKVGATMAEDVKLSWTGCIVPMQKAFAMNLEYSLLPEFEPVPDTFRVEFDLSEVEALKENRKLTAETMEIAMRAGIATRAEARDAMGYDWEDTDEVYLLPLNIIEVQKGMSIEDSKPEPVALPATTPMPNGNGMPKRKDYQEQRVIAAAPSGSPSRQQQALMRRFVREALSLESEADDDFQKFFADMGAQLADVAIDIMDRRKAKIEDEALAASIISQVEMNILEEDLAKLNGELYLKVARNTYNAINATIGLAVDLPDYRAQQIIKLGGRRAGLIDLRESTRKRLFRELAKGRELGEGPVELARRIRELVPAGTWSSPKVRARVIARTETLHAQRASALTSYNDAPNVSAVMVFDGRLATSDDDCIALDGKLVGLDEANDLMNEEHPNGTRSFAPVVD